MSPADGTGPRPLDDVIQPFQIEAGGVRGRLVRLGPAVDTVLGRHAFPPPVATMLAETLALTAVLAGGLKYDGAFSLQAVGDGPLRLLFADMTSAGDLRGYAQFDADRLAAEAAAPACLADAVPRLLGRGHLAFTVDQGPHTERYQGIVDLVGGSLSECARHYLLNSEQIASGLIVAAAPVAGKDGTAPWRAAALMIQRLPRPGDGDDEDWGRARVLMDTVRADELLDPALGPDGLLYRLFHEQGVRVYRTRRLGARCRCSRARVVRMLRAMPRDEVASLTVDGRVVVTCEFCNTRYAFDDAALNDLYAA